jgi:hypothetical protein
MMHDQVVGNILQTLLHKNSRQNEASTEALVDYALGTASQASMRSTVHQTLGADIGWSSITTCLWTVTRESRVSLSLLIFPRYSLLCFFSPFLALRDDDDIRPLAMVAPA